jgi:uncharacterized protein with FMN-binding domain
MRGVPRRALIASAATAAGLWLVLSFKTPSTNRAQLSAGPSTTAPPATTPPAPAPLSGPTTTRPPETTTPTGPAGTRTVEGPVVDTRFGPVQVAVTLQGTRIVDIAALQLPNDRRRSAEISDTAEPLLRSEALQIQSARVHVVSGATYTSDAYAESLQAALDQAG